MPVKMSVEELNAFLKRAFVQVADDYEVEDATEEMIRMRLKVCDRHLRPGGTVSGPSMFSLADVSMYLMTLARIGPKALAVTTNCAIDFMRKPRAGCDMIAEARLLKLGRQFSVGDVLLYSEGMAEPVARASLTYALPPAGSAADVDA